MTLDPLDYIEFSAAVPNFFYWVLEHYSVAVGVAQELSGGTSVLPVLTAILGDSEYLFPKAYLLRRELWKPHYRELMEPLLTPKGKRVTGLTDPEMLMWLSRESNRFPLNADHNLLMDRLYLQYFPSLPQPQRESESWQGAVDELYATYKKRQVR